MRKTYSPEFKAKLVMEVFKGERLLNEIASENNVHPNMLTRWKTEAANNLHVLFENENAKMRKQAKQYEAQIEELYTQIGKLTAQYEWMKKNLESNFQREERVSMVDFNDSDFSVSAQAQMLGLNRTSLYYKPRPSSEWDLQLNRLIDITYTKHPEFGYRRITAWLESYYGFHVDKKTVLSRMQAMGIQAVYPRQCTSRADPANTVYPDLLSGVQASCPDHVWSIDITYIPIQKSWLYLTAIIDWYSRFVLAWEVDDTLEITFVLDACKKALGNSAPEIMNSDQGSHFTSPRYTELFKEAGSKISMDHRGRAYDNIFIERFWRSLKYEDIYLKDYQYPREARKGIREYMDFYNNERPHQSLGYKTPSQVYHAGKPRSS